MKLRKIIGLVMALVICISLCACGEKASETVENPETTETPPVEATAAVSAEEPEEATEDLKAVASEYVGKEVSELFEVIGMPIESAYAPSCLGEGEDGEHHYDGFIVYTYKEGESEIVQVVL